MYKMETIKVNQTEENTKKRFYYKENKISNIYFSWDIYDRECGDRILLTCYEKKLTVKLCEMFNLMTHDDSEKCPQKLGSEI